MFSIVAFYGVLVFASASAEQCNLPPSVWCSSQEAARRCDVVKQCQTFLEPKKEAPLVNFTLYMESLCPDCKNFIKKQLYPTFKSVGSIMNLSIVPYGNAEERHVGSKWQFSCQHGEEECYGNLIETCAIHYHPNASVYFPFIHCIEASDQLPRNSAEGCAQKFGLDYSPIQSCVDGPLGNSLEHKMALRTNALQPPHQYVPWVTLNGLHTEQIEKMAERNLLELMCETYQGSPKPRACSQ